MPGSGATPSSLASQPVCGALHAYLEQATNQQAAGLGAYAVAFSGGVDSSALLLAWVDGLEARVAVGDLLPEQAVVQVLHVHHGLQAAADSFATHCIAVINTLQSQRHKKLTVKLHVIYAPVTLLPGQSTEELARTARYAALATKAQELGVSTVLLAQHADDQVETVLLALSRGAGLPGLAAMPRSFSRHGMQFARPLLELPRAALQALVQQAGWPTIEDPSNSDLSYTRNRIRAHVLPALELALPQFRQTVARSARHAAEAQALLDEIAQDKYAVVVASHDNAAISIVAIIALSAAQQRNTLRYWLKTQHATQASSAQLDALQVQLQTSQRHGAPRKLRLKVGRGFVFRAGDDLGFEAALV